MGKGKTKTGTDEKRKKKGKRKTPMSKKNITKKGTTNYGRGDTKRLKVQIGDKTDKEEKQKKKVNLKYHLNPKIRKAQMTSTVQLIFKAKFTMGKTK